MNQILIRPIRREDEAHWRALWMGYLEFYKSSVPEEVYRTTFDRFFSDAPYDPRCLLAEVGGELLGLVHYLPHTHSWSVDDVCYLQDLFVAPQARGTGLGRKLIEAVYAVADEKGWANVYWTTQHFNEAGRRLYDRVGELTPFIKYQRPKKAT